MSDVEALIAKALPFEALSPAALKEIAAAAEVIEAWQGDLIYKSRAPANALYIVSEGTVLLEPTSRGLPPQSVKAGEAFGWTALGGKAGRRYRAVAAKSSEPFADSSATACSILSPAIPPARMCGSMSKTRSRTSACPPNPARRGGRSNYHFIASPTGYARLRPISASSATRCCLASGISLSKF